MLRKAGKMIGIRKEDRMSMNRDIFIALLGGVIAYIVVGVILLRGNLQLENVILGIAMHSLGAMYFGLRFLNEERREKIKHYYGEPEYKSIAEALKMYDKDNKQDQ
jgi:hypothetical protein